MSQRRIKHSRLSRMIAWAAAALVHVAIIAAMVVKFSDNTENVKAHEAEKIDIVKAQTIDESQLKQQQAQRQREQQHQEQQRKAEQERKKRAAERRAREQKAIALKKQKEQAELERQKKERERLALEEKKRKEEQAAKKKEQERLAKIEQQRLQREQREWEAQQQLNQLLRDEEAKIAAQRTTTAISQAMARITNKIYAVRTVDPGFEAWRKSEVEVSVTPAGVVRSVRTIKSSGLPKYDQAAETAVFKASPLPIPDAATYPGAHQQFTKESFVLEITM